MSRSFAVGNIPSKVNRKSYRPPTPFGYGILLPPASPAAPMAPITPSQLAAQIAEDLVRCKELGRRLDSLELSLHGLKPIRGGSPEQAEDRRIDDLYEQAAWLDRLDSMNRSDLDELLWSTFKPHGDGVTGHHLHDQATGATEMYRTYGRKTRRPAFKTAAQEAAENRALDARLAAQDLERSERLNALVAKSRALKSPEQLAAEETHQAEVDARAAEQYRQNQEWLDRRRAERLSSWTSGT
jgi:hypothetical protein